MLRTEFLPLLLATLSLTLSGGCSQDAAGNSTRSARPSLNAAGNSPGESPQSDDVTIGDQATDGRRNSVWIPAVLRGSENVDWPQFRGIGGQGKSTETGLPVNWGPERNIVWKTALPGAGTSSPIFVGDRIFLTCYSGFGIPNEPTGDMNSLKLTVVCLNRSDGSLRWQTPVAPALPEQPTIRDEHGYASSTPAADDDHVYVFFGKTGVFAFDYDGHQKWHATVGANLNGWGSAASPVLCGDLLIVNASVESESLYALDKRTGTEVWRVPNIREAWNTPVLLNSSGGSTELIVPVLRNLLAFDPATGKKLWWCDTHIDWYMVPSAVVQDDVVYCLGGRSGGALAVRGGGRNDVEPSHVVWTGNKGSNVTSPVVHDGHLYWMSEKLGVAYCADAATGNIVYEERLPRAGQVYASAVLADGKIYYVARNGKTFVVAAKPVFELLATNETEERGRFDASPAIADGALFLRSNRFLHCIDE
ncbi:MAG: PQQ-binding-like beta-propeller repeat protein [Planctomycetaceae bacterium]